MQLGTTAPTFIRWLAAAIATMLVPTIGAEVRHLPLATIAVGDKPADVMSRSDVFLTEYRFQSGGHSYALSSALQGSVARDLVFIDDQLACVLKKRRYPNARIAFGSKGRWQFMGDPEHWEDPIAKWEWASEIGGLEYLAAQLRDACGLEPIRERREPANEWSSRTMTGAEIADVTAEMAIKIPVALIVFGLTYGGSSWPLPPGLSVEKRLAFDKRDRNEVEQRIWSLSLGLPQEALAAVLGVPDVQYAWPGTGTIVNAYRLGSPNNFFVGVIDGRATWIHADYPGLTLQSKIVAKRNSVAWK